MAMFTGKPDAFVREQMNLHFGIITGMTEPIVKPKGKPKKGDGKSIPFSEFSFINLMVFRQAFTEAKARGLLNLAETTMGNEVMAIMG